MSQVWQANINYCCKTSNRFCFIWWKIFDTSWKSWLLFVVVVNGSLLLVMLFAVWTIFCLVFVEIKYCRCSYKNNKMYHRLSHDVVTRIVERERENFSATIDIIQTTTSLKLAISESVRHVYKTNRPCGTSSL